MTTAPGFTQSLFTMSGRPTATTRMSAVRHTAARSTVLGKSGYAKVKRTLLLSISTFSLPPSPAVADGNCSVHPLQELGYRGAHDLAPPHHHGRGAGHLGTLIHSNTTSPSQTEVRFPYLKCFNEYATAEAPPELVKRTVKYTLQVVLIGKCSGEDLQTLLPLKRTSQSLRNLPSLLIV